MRTARALVFALGALVDGLACAQIDTVDAIVITDTKAFVVLPQEQIARQDVRSIDWSPDGRYALIVRLAPPSPNVFVDLIAGRARLSESPLGACEMLVYDSNGGRTVSVLSVQQPKLQIASVLWFHGSASALITAVEPGSDGTLTNDLILVDAVRSSSRILATSPDTYQLVLCPTRPMALSLENPKKPDGRYTGQALARLITADGKLSAPLALPGRFPMAYWSVGGTWCCQERESSKPKEIPRYTIDFAAGTTDSPNGPPPYSPTVPKTHLRVIEDVRAINAGGVKTLVRTAVLASSILPRDPGSVSAVLGTDASLSSLSPAGNAVIYCSRGCAYVRGLVEIPREAGLTAYTNSRRTVAIMDCRQCAVAAMMYASDSDDVLPTTDGFQDRLAPYMKNRSAMDSFIYTYQGGNLRDVKNPAETQLGYVAGPGGRAIAFADGHVRWYPD